MKLVKFRDFEEDFYSFNHQIIHFYYIYNCTTAVSLNEASIDWQVIINRMWLICWQRTKRYHQITVISKWGKIAAIFQFLKGIDSQNSGFVKKRSPLANLRLFRSNSDDDEACRLGFSDFYEPLDRHYLRTTYNASKPHLTVWPVSCSRDQERGEVDTNWCLHRF